MKENTEQKAFILEETKDFNLLYLTKTALKRT